MERGWNRGRERDKGDEKRGRERGRGDEKRGERTEFGCSLFGVCLGLCYTEALQRL